MTNNTISNQNVNGAGFDTMLDNEGRIEIRARELAIKKAMFYIFPTILLAIPVGIINHDAIPGVIQLCFLAVVIGAISYPFSMMRYSYYLGKRALAESPE